MAIRLHTCNATFIHGGHPCWKVMKALDEAGVDYEQVKHPGFPRGRRTEIIDRTGQNRLPVIELADGTMVRQQSAEMIRRIRAGELPPPA